MDHKPIVCPKCENEINISPAARSYGYMVVGLNILHHLDNCSGKLVAA